MIKTKASIARENQSEKDFKVIKFDGLKKLPKTRPPNQIERKQMNSDDEEFERIFGDGGPRKRKSEKPNKNEVTFERARKEIMNFGLNSSNSAENSDQISQLLQKLGAKPPKRQARNYKEILEEKKKKKEDDEKVNRRALFGTSASLQIQKRKFKNSDGLLKSYGKLDKKSLKQIKENGLKKRKR